MRTFSQFSIEEIGNLRQFGLNLLNKVEIGLLDFFILCIACHVDIEHRSGLTHIRIESTQFKKPILQGIGGVDFTIQKVLVIWF